MVEIEFLLPAIILLMPNIPFYFTLSLLKLIEWRDTMM